MTANTQIAQSISTTEPNTVDQQQYLTFTLSSEPYALSILCIKEIIQYGQLTEVPRMPTFIRGVINLRGAVVPVIDLSARFGRFATVVGQRNCIIIVEVTTGEEKHSIGVMVDAVNAVLEIPAREIENAPTFGTNVRTDFIEGMGKIDGKFVIILNVQHVLSMDDMAAMVASRSDISAELANS